MTLVIQDIGTLATAVGVFIAVLSLGASRRQRLRQFESLYVRRYWTIMDELSLDVMRGTPQNGAALSERDEKAIRSYLRLCEDQLELRKEGWISDETWQMWRNGIDAQLQRPAFSTIWEEIREGVEKAAKEAGESERHTHSEYELLRTVDCKGRVRDPQGHPSPWRRRARRLVRSSGV
jgi:hypothetical protein